MFERYTEQARRILFYARFEASSAGSEAITPAFLFLGLLQELPDLAHLRDEFRNQLPAPSAPTDASAEVSLSPEAKRALKAAAQAAAPAAPITPAHLLVGLHTASLEIAAYLETHGVTAAAIRARLPQQQKPPPPAPQTVQKTRRFVEFGPALSVTESVSKTPTTLRYRVSVEVNGETREWTTDFDLPAGKE